MFVWSGLGMGVDDFVLQLIGLRYTEPDMTISYPGFLYLLMKLDSMIRKGGHGCGPTKTENRNLGRLIDVGF